MRPQWSKTKIIIITLLIIAAAILNIYFLTRAKGEEREYTECWVLCQPDSYVNARLNPKKKSAEIGRLECGDNFYTDGKTMNGYVHCFGVGEWGEGWVHKGYVVYTKPYKPSTQLKKVESNGRVAARRTIDGARRCWLKNEQTIKVYMISEEWSVTNQGFVKTKFIESGIEDYERQKAYAEANRETISE